MKLLHKIKNGFNQIILLKDKPESIARGFALGSFIGMTEVAYYDGLGSTKVHDWGYFTAGLATKFDLTDNLAFVPGLYHQVTMDRAINKHQDITYTMLSMKYKF